ncbi:MAG TPA: periplasmic heavy metal sensor [Thermoanaerobaculia bacterium]|nr:periplasmic heavy metal sensor [Thermoanaerobaculia bacterium]
MKKRTTLILATVLAVAAIAAAPLVIAGPHGSRRGHGDAMAMHGIDVLAHLRHAKEELDHSDQQVEQIHAIFRHARETNAGSRKEMHGGLHEAAGILLNDPNAVAAAQAALDRQAAAERALKSNLLNAVAKAFAVLTPEQRTELRTMIEKRHGAREK